MPACLITPCPPSPGPAEFMKVCSRTAVGFIVMGFIGFFVKLLFIVSSRSTALAQQQCALGPATPLAWTPRCPCTTAVSPLRALQGLPVAYQRALGNISQYDMQRDAKPCAGPGWRTRGTALAGALRPGGDLRTSDTFAVPPVPSSAPAAHQPGHHELKPRPLAGAGLQVSLL